MNNKLRFLSALAGVLLVTAINAQEESNDQADVWAVIERQWNDDEDQDPRWIEELLADDFAGWDRSSPAPRNKTSTRMWDRVLGNVSEMKAHELYPLSIIVHGDVAVVHYLYSSAVENQADEIKMEQGRFTDILVRTDDGWKFLAWHGGGDGE
jgi:ketosteroid isomerase-like protein